MTRDHIEERTKTCAVEGCDKRKRNEGLCVAHYYKLKRYGDPLAGKTAKTPRGEVQRYISEVALRHVGDECLTWPFARDPRGYARGSANGKMGLASRIICERAHGPSPTSKHEAAHSCGKGHLGCVSPNHLRWATAVENRADKKLHGTVKSGELNHLSKLSAAQVRAIRSLVGGRTQEDIAAMFGISRATVSDISNGKSWSWLA